MSHDDKHVFDPECRGCQPAILDMTTMRPLPDDHPSVVTAVRVWKAATREEQECFHRVAVHNSREPKDVAGFRAISERIGIALRVADSN